MITRHTLVPILGPHATLRLMQYIRRMDQTIGTVRYSAETCSIVRVYTRYEFFGALERLRDRKSKEAKPHSAKYAKLIELLKERL